MTPLIAILRWDVVLQARNGFYWATAFLVLVVGGLLLAAPEVVRANSGVWVPALIAVNMQTTTFFFVAGLMLLERDEGTLAALAVSPLSAGDYLAARTLTLTALAGIETLALVWMAFEVRGAWLAILAGTAAVGVIYTAFGAAMTTRYESVNRLLLPASVVVMLLLLPLLPHFGFGPRWLLLVHPIEPALTLMRAGYGVGGNADLAFALAGSLGWCAIAFWWGRRCVDRLMRDARVRGGR
jgi:fluoroquinolone transport system permease protein